MTRCSEALCDREVARQVSSVLAELPGDQDVTHGLSGEMEGLTEAGCPNGFSDVSIDFVGGMLGHWPWEHADWGLEAVHGREEARRLASSGALMAPAAHDGRRFDHSCRE
jgi:hypothetical protein